MAKRKLSPEAKRAISEAARARWARYRAAKQQGIVTIGGRPGPKPGRGRITGGRRGRRPMGVGAAGGAAFMGQSTDELISMRRRIDQELADRYVREYQG